MTIKSWLYGLAMWGVLILLTPWLVVRHWNAVRHQCARCGCWHPDDPYACGRLPGWE